MLALILIVGIVAVGYVCYQHVLIRNAEELRKQQEKNND